MMPEKIAKNGTKSRCRSHRLGSVALDANADIIANKTAQFHRPKWKSTVLNWLFGIHVPQCLSNMIVQNGHINGLLIDFVWLARVGEVHLARHQDDFDIAPHRHAVRVDTLCKLQAGFVPHSHIADNNRDGFMLLQGFECINGIAKPERLYANQVHIEYKFIHDVGDIVDNDYAWFIHQTPLIPPHLQATQKPISCKDCKINRDQFWVPMVAFPSR
jgi:hypothetical protein